jgi:RNA polymerase sigma factor (sigma-70 family)
MPSGTMHDVMRRIRGLVARPALGGQSDEELLDQFVTGRDEESFAALVRRHGPMVLGVCLRLLHHRQDAEDAFQSAFLTLARKGHTIRRRGALPSWLYRVAFRIALRLKARADRRESPEVLGDVAVDNDPAADAGWRELRPMLDQEVQRLPKKYRTPMVLCYLEGKTYEEAASLLGCPKGTVAIRLLRGRQMLKGRLVRRGLFAAAGCVAMSAVLPQASAAVPMALAATTVGAAKALASGTALAAIVPGGIAALVDEASRSLWATKVKLACAAAVCLSLGGVVTQNSGVFRTAAAPAANAPVHVEAPPPKPAGDIAQAPPAPAAPAARDETPELGLRPRTYCRRGDDGRVLILVLHTERIVPRHPCSGLAMRGRLPDDQCAPEPAPAVRADANRTARAIVFIQQHQIDLFGGLIRVIYVRHSFWVRA